MPVSVALIGTGFGATVQAPGFHCVDGADLVAVASARLERARAVAAEFGIRHAFDDYRAMLETVRPDLVTIATPPYLHHPMAVAALEAGAHVLCEKPMSMDLTQARAMLAAAEKLGRVHAVDHEFRYVPARAALKRMIDRGEIGEIFLLRIADIVSWPVDRPFDWWFDRSRGGGVLGALGSHWIDALRYWVAPVVSVTGRLGVVVPLRRRADGSGSEPVTADDTAVFTARLENGSLAHVDLSVAARPPVRRVEVYGTRGALVLEGTLLFRDSESRLQPVPLEDRDQGRLEDPRLGPFVELAQRVVDRINGRPGRDFPTFADGVEVQRVMDAVRRSSEEGREVHVTESRRSTGPTK